jgi:hypothetical protein
VVNVRNGWEADAAGISAAPRSSEGAVQAAIFVEPNLDLIDILARHRTIFARSDPHGVGDDCPSGGSIDFCGDQMFQKLPKVAATCAAALSFSSCGGDEGSAPTPTPPPPPAVTVTVTPNDVGLAANATQQFACTVTGSTNTQCGWSVQPGGGTITAGGLYTAPGTAGLYNVIATSIGDPSRTATAMVRVSAPSGGGGNVVRPGLGNDPGTPLVTSLSLPAGVRIDGVAIGADAEGGQCADRDAVIGSGGAVRACVSICMDTAVYQGTDGASIDLSDGLILISEFQDGQNGLLVERVRINVPFTPCSGGYSPGESEEQRRAAVTSSSSILIVSTRPDPPPSTECAMRLPAPPQIRT